jgi:hypothetical protein
MRWNTAADKHTLLVVIASGTRSSLKMMRARDSPPSAHMETPEAGRMAILLKQNGIIQQIFPKDKSRGFSLDEIYQLIGNGCEMVKAVDLADGRSMWLDEEGKYRQGLRENLKATELLMKAGGIPGDVVTGNVLIEKGEVQREWFAPKFPAKQF